jgi:hypothetical protein
MLYLITAQKHQNEPADKQYIRGTLDDVIARRNWMVTYGYRIESIQCMDEENATWHPAILEPEDDEPYSSEYDEEPYLDFPEQQPFWGPAVDTAPGSRIEVSWLDNLTS